MSWVLVGGGVWIGLALGAALLIGQSIHMADAAGAEVELANFVVDPSVPLVTEALEFSIPAPALSPEVPSSEAPTAAARPEWDNAVPATRPPVIGQCISAEERVPSAQPTGTA